jgi:hypothetical protein
VTHRNTLLCSSRSRSGVPLLTPLGARPRMLRPCESARSAALRADSGLGAEKHGFSPELNSTKRRFSQAVLKGGGVEPVPVTSTKRLLYPVGDRERVGCGMQGFVWDNTWFCF